MDTVAIKTLKPGQAFKCPWRPSDRNIGFLTDVGRGSVGVRIRGEYGGEGLGETRWAETTMVIPVVEGAFYTQTSVNTERNKSTVDSPVDRVWAICNELKAKATKKKPLTPTMVIEKSVAEGINKNTAKTQYYAWRKSQ